VQSLVVTKEMHMAAKASGNQFYLSRLEEHLKQQKYSSDPTGRYMAVGQEIPLYRHSTAISLVAQGVDVIVIRDWLGHARLDTTNHARVNVETKRKALEKAGASARPGKPPRWKRKVGLLEWLDSL
jgi:site-specific recombinase XerD